MAFVGGGVVEEAHAFPGGGNAADDVEVSAAEEDVVGDERVGRELLGGEIGFDELIDLVGDLEGLGEGEGIADGEEGSEAEEERQEEWEAAEWRHGGMRKAEFGRKGRRCWRGGAQGVMAG